MSLPVPPCGERRLRTRAVGVVLLPLSLGAASAFAQPAGVAPTSLSPVVVTAARMPTRIDETLAEVTVIEREEIERAAGRTLPELLARSPGLQFSANGGLCKNSSVYVRGLEFRHMLVLVDGVRHGSATTGTPSLENLPLGAIERIEIVRGPMSGLYGSDAVGGVVHIFTRRGEEGAHPRASVTAGARRYGQMAGGVAFGQGAWSGSVHAQHTQNRGRSATNPDVPFGNFNPDRDGCRQHAFGAGLGRALGAGWRIDGRVFHSDAVTRIDDGPEVDSKAGLRSEVLALTVQGPVTSAWHSRFQLSQVEDVYDALATASAFQTLGKIGTRQMQFTWENTVPTPLGAAIVLLDHVRQKVRRPGEPFARSDRHITGIGAGLNGAAGAHSWQASVRHDRNSQFGSQTNGSLGYGYDLAPAWRIGASVGTSFVAPSFNQLYFPGFGNPALRPEEGSHRELSLRWADAGHQLRLAWFDNRIRGYIPSGPQPANIPRTRIDGLSLSYEASVANWTLSGSAEHVRPVNATSGSANEGNWLPRRARHALRLAADVDLGAWRLGGGVVAFGHRYDDAANTVRVGGYTTLDLRADWRFAPRWALGLRLNNATDKRYETVKGYNQAGRELYVTLRYGD